MCGPLAAFSPNSCQTDRCFLASTVSYSAFSLLCGVLPVSLLIRGYIFFLDFELVFATHCLSAGFGMEIGVLLLPVHDFLASY